MAAPHYAEILSGGPRPVFGEAPARLRQRSWKLWYIPNDDSTYGSTRMLLWVKKSGGGTGLALQLVQDSGCKVQVVLDGVVKVERLVTFDARQRLKITVDGEAGTLEIDGATSGNGVVTGDTWSEPGGGGEWRVGTGAAAATPARGYVSLPYG